MSLEMNKIAASVLTAGVVAMGTGFIAELLVHPKAPEEPVYKVAVQEKPGGAGQEAAEPAGPEPILPLLADADPEAGRQAMRACGACHSFEKGGPNKLGPNLYGVVGNDIAGDDGFGYSSALSGKEGAWTYEKLNAYLYNPSEFAPGTNMSFPGIKDRQERADVVAWLRQNDDDPMALPTEEEIAAAKPEAEAEQAGGDQQAADEGAQEAGDTQTAESETGAAETGASGGDGALLQKIAAADPAKGEAAARVCSACHSFEQGGPHKVGPNLYGVVGRDIASAEGFNRYSDVLKNKQGEWTYAKLDKYIENPNAWAPGNRMTFPGVKDEAKRMAVIAYLRQFTENPPPLE